MLNFRSFKKMKKKDEKIVMLTAYDYPTAKCVEKSQADLILVGDSLGMVVLGYPDTLEVTIDDMVHHCKAVRRGAPDTFVVCDMPYMSYHISIEETKRNAARLMLEARANAVKLEGGSDSRLEVIRALVDCEIPVVAHLGLTPQSVNKFGGYKVQGKSEKRYDEILDRAKKVAEAGASMLVLEGIPEKLGKEITESIKIPTIGIGAGRFCDGQVLVYYDLLGYSELAPKFMKKYGALEEQTVFALHDFVREVKSNDFPDAEHCYYPIDTEIDK